MQTQFIKGIIYILLSCLALAAMGAFAKAAGPNLNTSILVFFQNLICLVFILPWALYPQPRQLKTQHLGLHFIRAITGAAAWYGLFFAIKLISLSNAVLLTYSAPLWIPLIIWLIFRQKIKAKIWGSVALGFIGIALVLNPHANWFKLGDIVAIAAAILLAMALLSVKFLNRTESIKQILFYYFLLSTILFLPFILLQWHLPNLIRWIYIFCVGICLLLSQVFIIFAYHQAPPSKLGPFIYSVIIFTAIINWLIWQQSLKPLELMGMALVIIGGVLTMLGEKAVAAEEL